MPSRLGRLRRDCILLALIVHAAPALSGTVPPATDPGMSSAPLPNAFPAIPTAAEGAPNILLVLTDDVGFGAASAFGGPVPTPNLERLAQNGLRYNRFHTTAMCSPTRAALLTGRNHHAVDTGTLTDFAFGAPGYDAMIPRSAATIARLLQDNGYNTAFFGKHHNIPKGPFSSSGPYDYFPTKLGFDHFFGFIGSDTDQWRPTLYRDTSRVIDEKPPSRILDQRLADEAIDWIHQQKAAAPDKPFFIYFAPGSAHTPHQAPADWIERFHGQFAQGWDKLRAETLQRQKAMGLVPARISLPRRPDYIPAWQSLSMEERAFQQRQMEVFAAQLAFQDAQFGRIVDELRRMGLSDNTLVIFIEGDNGPDSAASPAGAIGEATEIANRRLDLTEHRRQIDQLGGPRSHSNYSTGWALAMSTPFPYYKQIASHLGGTRNGAVFSWPSRITERGMRSQYHHVIDVFPTILHAAGIKAPDTVDGIAQQPVDGIDMTYSFADPRAPDRRTTQYYEMLGNRALYDHGWLANTRPVRKPWEMGFGADANLNLAPGYRWELYDLATDFNQTRDLAASHPAILARLRKAFDVEAARYKVFPINDRTDAARSGLAARAYIKPRSSYIFWGKDISLPSDVAPPITGRAFTLTADVTAGNGVIAALGSSMGGWSFGVEDGHPVVRHALTPLPEDQFRLAAPTVLQPGSMVRLTFDFNYDGGGYGKGGLVSIAVNGAPVAEQRLERSLVVQEAPGETFDIGLDGGGPVNEAAGAPDRFTGEIRKLEVTLGPPGARRQ